MATIKQLREQLGAYLTKPLPIGSGNIATQQNIGATSLSSGGLEGQILIKSSGEIVHNDGTSDRVKIGNITNV